MYIYLNSMNLNPSVWGPHFWFVFHTIALSYPKKPNEATIKRYNDFIRTIPILIPNDKMSISFGKLIDEYPVSPYLGTRKGLIRWFHFIHNKVNKSLKKRQISMKEFYVKYYEEYKSSDKEKLIHKINKNRKLLYYGVLISLILFIVYVNKL